MAESSSTSSSELSAVERVPTGRFPRAFVAFVAIVVAIELSVSAHREWFADLAAWQWETKRTLLASGALDGDIAILGTSVLFHGIDPTVANDALGQRHRVVNLSLNGMLLQHQAQLLRERAASQNRPAMVVLELRHATVAQDSWTTGPYFRFWASTPEFWESGFYYWQPSLALTFASERLLPSFRYREALDNWIFDSLHEGRPAVSTLARNRAVADEMRRHGGFVRATFENQSQRDYSGPRKPRVWAVDIAGWNWLRDLLGTAAASNMRVVLLLPPAPPYVYEEPGPSGFRAKFNADLARLSAEFPRLRLTVFEPTGYDLSDFADPIHLSLKGRQKLSRDFAVWLRDHTEPRDKPADTDATAPTRAAQNGNTSSRRLSANH
jgi:hypothetical protein